MQQTQSPLEQKYYMKETLGPLAPERSNKKRLLLFSVSAGVVIAVMLLILRPDKAHDAHSSSEATQQSQQQKNISPPDASDSVVDPSVRQNTDVPYSPSRRY